MKKKCLMVKLAAREIDGDPVYAVFDRERLRETVENLKKAAQKAKTGTWTKYFPELVIDPEYLSMQGTKLDDRMEDLLEEADKTEVLAIDEETFKALDALPGSFRTSTAQLLYHPKSEAVEYWIEHKHSPVVYTAFLYENLI